MILLAQILFWCSLFLILHSYVFFPFFLYLLAKNKKENNIKYTFDDDLPTISIIMAVHNEELIIEQKILSVFNTSYPVDKIEFLIGSDNSNDKTNLIITNLQNKYSNINFVDFKERSGKIKIINSLSQKARNKILIITDAKAIFEKETIFYLIEHFKNIEIDIVGASLINPNKVSYGISSQENLFMNREMKIKYRESLIWQKTIGVYGALYAIRKTDFIHVPENLLVDDFYETMKILENNGKVVFSLKARAVESLPVELSEEFRRKVRISAGNFQNLKIFNKILLKPFSSLGFAFISHKVIRWLTPFIFIFAIICAFLISELLIYKLFLYSVFAIFLIPVVDYILQKFNININFFRLISHFIAMNFAVVVGFIKAIVGIKKSYWKPSNRIN